MAMFGQKKSGPPTGPERVLGCLAHAQSMGVPFRLEDGRGCEVPATLDPITGNKLTLRPEGPLDLPQGARIQLVFILDGSRFKAPSRVLEAESGWISVALPTIIHPAERRKMARGYLNAREGAAAMAFAGLFNPLNASSSSTSMGSLHALVDETGARSPSMRESQGIPLAVPEMVESSDVGQPQPLRVERPWARREATSGSTFWTSYVVDWLRARRISLNSSCTTSVVEQSVKLSSGALVVPAHERSLLHFTERNPFLGQGPTAKKLGRDAFPHGITYTFLSRTLPETWRRVFPVASVKFEAYCAGNDVRLGIRVR